MYEWIDIEDRTPPNDVYVLTCYIYFKMNTNFVGIRKRFNQDWFDDHNEEKIDDKKGKITHWMPLPDDPDKIKKEVNGESDKKNELLSVIENLTESIQQLSIQVDELGMEVHKLGLRGS